MSRKGHLAPSAKLEPPIAALPLQPSDCVDLMRFFFFQAEDGIRDYKVTRVQTCALPISNPKHLELWYGNPMVGEQFLRQRLVAREEQTARIASGVEQFQQFQMADDVLVEDRKSTRLNSSHLVISYAVFCLKKKKVTNSLLLRSRRRISTSNSFASPTLITSPLLAALAITHYALSHTVRLCYSNT